MKRKIAVGLALAVIVTSTGVEAQLGGLLRKKAGEVLGGKKASPPPAPAPEDEAPEPAAPTPARGESRVATPAAEKKAVSPLEMSALPVRQSADMVLRDRISSEPNGDWDRMPYMPAAAVAAAYALDEAAQIALVETVGTALKALVMSDAFVAEHNAYIKDEHKAVNHGLTGIATFEDAVKKNDLKTIEAMTERQRVAMFVELTQSMPAAYLKTEFDELLASWKKDAANPKERERAKYQKLVTRAQAVEPLFATDEAKFRRGYAVLRSIEADGPDTEDAVFAIQVRETQEKEQLAFDEHNLKGQLKRQLTSFVAIAAKVDFDAPTVEKGRKTLFVNAAQERQGLLWKACFRAGQAPTAAAVKFAKAWLAEL